MDYWVLFEPLDAYGRTMTATIFTDWKLADTFYDLRARHNMQLRKIVPPEPMEGIVYDLAYYSEWSVVNLAVFSELVRSTV